MCNGEGGGRSARYVTVVDLSYEREGAGQVGRRQWMGWTKNIRQMYVRSP